MQIEMSNKDFRRLLDLVYIGNWILNSMRGDERFADYDNVESQLFGLCAGTGMQALTEYRNGNWIPSLAYSEGGIHEAIALYEDNAFFQILAEELSRRDMEHEEISEENYPELIQRMDGYMEEFFTNGVDRLVLED